jgi:hypothetical protein
VAAEELGGGVHDEVGAQVDGALQAGVTRVASTSSGTRASWAISAMAGMSSTSRPGLPMASPNSRRVSGRMAARQASLSPGRHEGGLDAEAGQGVGQQVVGAAVQRARGDDVPPLPISVVMASIRAAWPLAQAIAPTPPSRAAMRSSSTALVGLEMRE